MKPGKRENVSSFNRARYTKLPNIEEGTQNEDGGRASRQKINWKKILLKGFKYVLLLTFLGGVGFGAVVMSYPCIFKSGL